MKTLHHPQLSARSPRLRPRLETIFESWEIADQPKIPEGEILQVDCFRESGTG